MGLLLDVLGGVELWRGPLTQGIAPWRPYFISMRQRETSKRQRMAAAAAILTFDNFVLFLDDFWDFVKAVLMADFITARESLREGCANSPLDHGFPDEWRVQ